MSRLRIVFSVGFLILLTFCCGRRLCGCDPVVESPLKGDWNLIRITYGLTQRTVTAAEAGYTEMLSFNNFGSYRQVRNGIPVRTEDYSFSPSNGSSSTGLLYFSADTTQQSFQLKSGQTLILSERGPRGATIADGSTYEYQRQ